MIASQQMQRRALLWLLGGFIVLFAFAASAESLMSGGSGGINSGFSCSGGSPSGELLTSSGDCADGPQDGKIISYFVCQFEALLNEILSKVYCAVVDDAKPAVIAALTLLVVFAGAGFLTGMLPFTAKELAVLGAKFSLVLAFATQAEYMIGVGYNLFVTITKEGIVIVLDRLLSLSSLGGSGGGMRTVDDVYDLFDSTLQDIFKLAAEGEKEGNECKNAIFVMLVAIAAVIPPLAAIAVYFVIQMLWMVLRAIFGYCQGLLGLTFLVVLSPIYVSFALFKPTRTLFDKWVKYLISFSFQMVIVFAFLGMVFYMLSKVADDVQSYADLVQPHKQTAAKGAGILNFTDTCGICEMEKGAGVGDKPSCKGGGKVLPLDEMHKDEEFLGFMTVKVMAMLLLFYIFDIMLGFVPEMAKHLAGPKYAGQLGGGRGGNNIPVPGEQAVGKLLSSAGGAYMRSGDPVSGGINAMKGVLANGVLGDGGVVDSMIRGVANPNEPLRNPAEFDSSPAGNLFGAAAALTGMGAAVSHFTSGSSGAGSDNTPDAPDSPPDKQSNDRTASATTTPQQRSIEAQQHLANVQREGADIAVADRLSTALAQLPEGASVEEIRRVVEVSSVGASRADLVAALDSLALQFHNQDIIDELRRVADTRTTIV